MQQKLSDLIARAVRETYDIDVDATISRPEPQFGDYATNVALQITKAVDKPPREIAQQLAKALSSQTSIAAVDVAGPGFLNITVAASQLFAELDDSIRRDRAAGRAYGESEAGAGKTVVVEFPSANMAKPYSVGHMRPANQGWAMKRLMEATGWRVITDNHLGDYGTPFGKWVVGFLHFGSEEQLEAQGVHELARVYVEVTRALKEAAGREEHQLADEVQSWLIRLEQGDVEAVSYSTRFNTISLAHMHHVMQRMEIETDHELGEAYFAPRGKQLVVELIDKGIAERNADGSVIVRLDAQGIDVPMLILKSNGAALYATTDLATLYYREEHWRPDRIIHAVGAEQQFYFQQLFALSHKLGFTTEMVHIWWGIIDQIDDEGVRSKMSSRKGVVLMEELLDVAEERTRQMVKSDDLDDDDVRAIALGTIKFTDLAQDRRKGMLFDWDAMFSLTGYSGPFVQYAAVRINKILRDNPAERTVEGLEYDWKAEKDLILHLLDYPRIVATAAESYEAHRIAIYAYDLARTLNRYYEQTPIATGEVSPAESQARLYLLAQASAVSTHALSLLGIRVPGRM